MIFRKHTAIAKKHEKYGPKGRDAPPFELFIDLSSYFPGPTSPEVLPVVAVRLRGARSYILKSR